MNMMLNFNRPKKDTLMYGKTVCPRNHTDMQGRPVRRIDTKHCWACDCKLPEGKFNFDFGELPQQEYKWNRKYNTPEEKRQARVASQVAWNKRNPEKVRGYVKKYSKTPGRLEKVKEKSKKYYAEHRDEILARNREQYYKAKEERLNQKIRDDLINTIFGTE